MTDRESFLVVYLYGRPVGFLTIRGNLTSFEFFEEYLGSSDRPVLGQLFEEEPRGRWRQAQRVPVWFSNLLPEDGPLLDFIASEIEVSPRREVELLSALGSDLPGAVAVQATTLDLNELQTRRFDLLGEVFSTPPVAEGGLRFSVAGVQPKLSMIRSANSLRLAGRGEFGNTYVKLPGSIPRLPENEFAMMYLAGMCGLNVPRVSLTGLEELGNLPDSFRSVSDTQVFVIDRFDRIQDRQVHIEDINQVIGNWPENKYRGLSYEGLGRLIRRMCGESDFWEYFRRLVFLLVMGNEDAHLKNWSLIYPDQVNPRLAPLYDVVSTVVLPGFTREIALKLGGSRRPQTIDLGALVRVAEKAGEDEIRAAGEVEAMFSVVREHEPAVRAMPWLSKDQWAVLDDYRQSVPLLRAGLAKR